MGLHGISVRSPDPDHTVLPATEVDLPPHKKNDCDRDTPLSVSAKKQTDATAKPYSCAECPSRFTLERSLQQHGRLHSGTCPRCCLCGKRFQSKSRLAVACTEGGTGGDRPGRHFPRAAFWAMKSVSEYGYRCDSPRVDNENHMEQPIGVPVAHRGRNSEH